MSQDDFETRLATEQRDLQERMRKLIDFLCDPATNVKALADINLLRTQYKVMSVYNDVLLSRMLTLGIQCLPVAGKL